MKRMLATLTLLLLLPVAALAAGLPETLPPPDGWEGAATVAYARDAGDHGACYAAVLEMDGRRVLAIFEGDGEGALALTALCEELPLQAEAGEAAPYLSLYAVADGFALSFGGAHSFNLFREGADGAWRLDSLNLRLDGASACFQAQDNGYTVQFSDAAGYSCRAASFAGDGTLNGLRMADVYAAIGTARDTRAAGLSDFLAGEDFAGASVWAARHFETDDACRAFAVFARGGEITAAALSRDAGGAWRIEGQNALLLRNETPFEQQAHRPDLYFADENTFSFQDDDLDFQLRRDAGGVWYVTGYSFAGADGAICHLSARSTDAYDLAYPNVARWGSPDGMTDASVSARCDLDLSLDGFDPAAARAFVTASIEDPMQAVRMPPAAFADALPEPVLVDFPAGEHYAVYSGPGTQYARESEGKAVVSANGWIQVFGREGDWLLIQYNVDETNNRFGYIAASALPRGVRVPELNFDGRAAVASGLGWATNDPLRNNAEEYTVQMGDNATWLASLGREYVYIEYTDRYKGLCRCFVLRDILKLRADYAGAAVVYTLNFLSRASVYDAPEGAVVAQFYNGAPAQVLSRGDEWTRVRLGSQDAPLEGYIRTAELRFDVPPTDVRSAVREFSVTGFAPGAAGGYLQLLTAPDAAAPPTQSGSVYEGWSGYLLGTAGDYAFVAESPAGDGRCGFLRRDALLVLPAAGGSRFSWRASSYACAAVETPLLLEPAPDAAPVARFLPGVPFEVYAQTGGYALVRYDANSRGGPSISGYVRIDHLHPFSSLSEINSPLPLAVVRLSQGVSAMGKTGADANSGDAGMRYANGAQVMVLGTSGDFALVRMGKSSFFLPAAALSCTGETAPVWIDTVAQGFARVRVPAGEGVPVWGQPGTSGYAHDTLMFDCRVEVLCQCGDFTLVAYDGWYSGFVENQYLTDITAYDQRLLAMTQAEREAELGEASSWTLEQKAAYQSCLLPGANDIPLSQALAIARAALREKYGLADTDLDTCRQSEWFSEYFDEFGARGITWQIRFQPPGSGVLYEVILAAQTGEVIAVLGPDNSHG